VTLADVAFDVPLDHPFSYRVPSGWTLAVGQRVFAPLGRAERVGVVVGLRDDDAAGLKPLTRVVDALPVLDANGLALAGWIAEQSLSSLGGTLAALLPPAGSARRHSDDAVRTDEAIRSREASRTGHPRFKPASPSDTEPGESAKPDVFIGLGRERRLLERVAAATAATLVIVPDVEAAGRWAQRLDKHGPVARLDSGVDDATRAGAWAALTAGDARLAVGTRSALLAPLPINITTGSSYNSAPIPGGPAISQDGALIFAGNPINRIDVVARSVWGATPALVAPVLWMTYPFVLWLTKQPNSEIPFLIVFYGAFGLFWSALIKPSVGTYGSSLLTGILVGAATLIRPIAVGAGVAFGAVLWLTRGDLTNRRRVTLVAVLLLGNVAAVLPRVQTQQLREGIGLGDASGIVDHAPASARCGCSSGSTSTSSSSPKTRTSAPSFAARRGCSSIRFCSNQRSEEMMNAECGMMN